MHSDQDFAAAAAVAREEAIELMEEEALERATKGTLEPVYHAGERVGFIRRKSDTLLIFLLKAARPNKYRERTGVVIENPEEIARKIHDFQAQLAEASGMVPAQPRAAA